LDGGAPSDGREQHGGVQRADAFDGEKSTILASLMNN
jgi:hypothetical protein